MMVSGHGDDDDDDYDDRFAVDVRNPTLNLLSF